MKEYADITVPFGPHSDLTHLEARVIARGGFVLPVKPADIYERPAVPDFMLYSDMKEKVFAVPGFTDSCILEVTYTREAEGPYIIDQFEFGRPLPVRSSEYSYKINTFALEKGLDVKPKCYNLDQKPEQRLEGVPPEFYVYSWSLENLPTVPTESWMPPTDEVMPRVVIGAWIGGSSARGWQGFAMYYYEGLPNFRKQPEEIRDLARSLAASTESQTERILNVADYIGDNIRYVAVDLAESGLAPNDPEAIIRNKYGDSKDMSVLAVMLLNLAGVEAHPALLRTRNMGGIDKDLFAPRFNHMIVYIETSNGGEVWLDPTVAPCPLGYLPYYDMDVDALVIKDGTALWKHTPPYTIYGSSRTSHTSATLTADGKVTGSATLSYKGGFAINQLERIKRAAGHTLDAEIEAALRSYIAEAKIDSCRLVRAESRPPSVTLTGDFVKPMAAILVDDNLIIRRDFLHPRVFELADIAGTAKRRFPLWFPDTWGERDTLRLVPPPGWEISRTPEACELRTEFGSYRTWGRLDGHEVVVITDYALSADSVVVEDLDRFLEFWKDVRTRSIEEIVFTRAESEKDPGRQ